MTRSELHGKVGQFVHGVDSHGNLLTPWGHEKDCVMCNRLADFIEGLLNEHDKSLAGYKALDSWMDRRERGREEEHLEKLGISRMDLLEEKQKQLAEFVNNEINSLKQKYKS